MFKAGTNAFILRALGFLGLVLLLQGCGGGGGGSGAGTGGGAGGGGGAGSGAGGSSPSISFAATTFNFVANTPASEVPAQQVLSATVTNVTSGTLYLLITVGDPQVVTVSDTLITGATSGQATLSVPSPAKLGMGTHTSTIQVRACLNSQTCASGELVGSPRTITVNYQVGSPVQQDTMMPAVAIANTPGRTVLRGSGFTGVTGATFGSASATAVTVVNDTELHVEYPAMTAGAPLAVTLQKSSSNVSFGATLTIVDPIAFAAATLAVPAVTGIRYIPVGVTFDSVHSALLIGMRAISDSPVGLSYMPEQDVILRYSYSGNAWLAPTARSFPRLHAITLTPDSQTLLAASRGAIDLLDAATLVSTRSTLKPGQPNEYIRALAYMNDGNVVVATGYENGSGATRLYLYSMQNALFAYPRLIGNGQFATNLFYYAQLGASADGSVALLGEPASGGGLPLQQYQAATGKWVRSTQRYNYQAGDALLNSWAPAIDERGARFIISGAIAPSGGESFLVLDSDLEPSGKTTDSGLVLLSRDGNRAYVLEGAQGTPPLCSVRAFDLTAVPATASGAYLEITTGGYPIARPCLSAVYFNSLGYLSPEGRTLFIAGSTGVQVIPLP